jgi:hypothetical protein
MISNPTKTFSMNYKSLKYIGAAGWAFTYICFIVIAAKFEWSMIPLAVCSYNIAYELLYTILATERGQRIRNGVWFGLDLFIIYNHIENTGAWQVFLMWFFAMLIIQIVLNWKLSKEATKSFAWFVTLLMAILIIWNTPPFWSAWVVAALIGKTIGDAAYGFAHLKYGVPGIPVKGLYYQVLRFTIIATALMNLIMILDYLEII